MWFSGSRNFFMFPPNLIHQLISGIYVENLTLIPTRICRQLSCGTESFILITISLYPPSGDIDMLDSLATLNTYRKNTECKYFTPIILFNAIPFCPKAVFHKVVQVEYKQISCWNCVVCFHVFTGNCWLKVSAICSGGTSLDPTLFEDVHPPETQNRNLVKMFW